LDSNEKLNSIKKNDVAEVTIKTKTPICFDAFSDTPSLGRFVIIDDYNTAGGGIISSATDSIKSGTNNVKSKNIAIRKRLVSKKQREEALNQKGKVIWLTGLPGCGKNEIAVKLEKRLFDLGKKVYYIDSAHLRFGLSSDLAFSKEDAREQTRRIAEVADLFADSGTITIVSSVSRFRDDRENAKEIIGNDNYIEVLIEATEKICKKRNPNAFNAGDKDAFKYEKAEYPIISLSINDAQFNSDKKADSIIELINL